jgi:hypothetical protein
MANFDLAGFFRGVYAIAVGLLAASVALCWPLWGWRVAAGIAAGGLISIGVLLSWQWLGAWIIAAPRGHARRRLILAWPLKYAAIGAVLYVLLRWNAVNVFALAVGLGLVQAVMLGRALVGAKALVSARDSN